MDRAQGHRRTTHWEPGRIRAEIRQNQISSLVLRRREGGEVERTMTRAYNRSWAAESDGILEKTSSEVSLLARPSWSL